MLPITLRLNILLSICCYASGLYNKKNNMTQQIPTLNEEKLLKELIEMKKLLDNNKYLEVICCADNIIVGQAKLNSQPLSNFASSAIAQAYSFKQKATQLQSKLEELYPIKISHAGLYGKANVTNLAKEPLVLTAADEIFVLPSISSWYPSL
jgi:hypothetical protein